MLLPDNGLLRLSNIIQENVIFLLGRTVTVDKQHVTCVFYPIAARNHIQDHRRRLSDQICDSRAGKLLKW